MHDPLGLYAPGDRGGVALLVDLDRVRCADRDIQAPVAGHVTQGGIVRPEAAGLECLLIAEISPIIDVKVAAQGGRCAAYQQVDVPVAVAIAPVHTGAMARADRCHLGAHLGSHRAEDLTWPIAVARHQV